MASRPWQRDDPEAVQVLRERLRVDFPELHLVERGHTMIVVGTFPLVDGQKVVDRFAIELELPRAYPKGVPVLREVGRRIPRVADRHVEDDGKSCAFLPDEFCYKHPNGVDLIDLLKGPVLGFLVGQSLAERGLPWPQGERAHGADGIIAFYSELIGSTDPVILQRHLEVLAAKQVRGHWSCPCGSGKRLRECHQKHLLELRARIPQSVARGSLERVRGKEPRP
jgi:hypothetical protein